MRSWKKGRFEVICNEMKENNLEILALTQTNLRGDVVKHHQGYKLIGKGRDKYPRQGGGIGVIFKEN